MFIRNPYDLLLEAAGNDLTANTEGYITENAIHESLNNIEELDEDVIIGPEMVPVLKVSESYLVEMNSIASFMKTNGIKSTERALDLIAEANNMMPKDVGLLIESDDYVDSMLEKANANFKKTKNKKAKNKVLEKVKKATKLTDKLKKDGYTVKKKRSCKDEACEKEACGTKKEACKNKPPKMKDEACGDKKEACKTESYSGMFNFDFK